jgi:hypothetical protein
MRKLALVLGVFGVLSFAGLRASAHETGTPHEHKKGDKKKSKSDKKEGGDGAAAPAEGEKKPEK